MAIAEVADYIEKLYNRTRRHSHLGGLSLLLEAARIMLTLSTGR